MTSMHELKNVSDDELLRRLSDLLRQSRRVESVLVAHIAEVDARRLYARDAGSMFTYCTQVLHLSEHEAYARITVARASRRFPELLAMLADGRLHLSGIAKLAPHLIDENRTGLLARAAHKTKAQIEELVAEIAPKADVPPTMRKLPTREPIVTPPQLGPDRVTSPAEGLSRSEPSPTVLVPARTEPQPPASSVPVATPLSRARYKVQFTATVELRDKLERLQALLHQDLAAVIDTAVTEKLERLEAKRFGLTKSPRKSLEEIDVSPRSRYLPAPVRRLVRQRDGNQCTFINQNGSRCAEHRGLEFHHREPYGRGGAHSPDNVCVMCREHNAYSAELEYGRERMEKYRRPDRVSEGWLEYPVGLPLGMLPSHGATGTGHA